MTFTLQTDPDTIITTLTACGAVSANDLLAELQKFYAHTATELALCDLSNADLGSFSSAEVEHLVASTRIMANTRARKRTAIVAGDDLGYGLSRMYQILAEV